MATILCGLYEEGPRYVLKHWSFYYRIIGFRFHNNALYLCVVLYIYITQQFTSKYVSFESTLLNFYLRKPLRNWTFQRTIKTLLTTCRE